MSTRLLQAAEQDAARASTNSGVTLRELSGLEECQAAEAVCNQVFSPDAGTAAVTVEWLRVLAKTGNYVGGAFEGDQLVAMAVGVRSGPTGASLHSHVAAVLGERAGRGIGFALKLHQRAWALRKEMPSITWTFDPLVRRNAHLNLVKLAARPTDYLPNFYGPLRDAINGDDETDRLLLDWPLQDERVQAVARGERCAPPEITAEESLLLEVGDDGSPRQRQTAAPLLGIAIPADIESLRATHPQLARDWRLALRDTLGTLMNDGYRYRGFRSEGVYLLARGDGS
ncbi:GNAT family N-acetyltransferase [Nocardioides sp.]|uniref:GNAT family N-acetyltransferase n=1 Tax=Nocardioides sp. TaxID=35761 RepID=UPI003D0D158E